VHRAKNSGKNRWHSSILEIAPIGNRLELENGLRRALDRNELEVFYQPIFNTATGRLANMEALLRWRHPRLGLVPPGQFISIAEETGLIVPIGRWVLEQACREAHGWHQAGNGGCKVSVNVSAVQFARDDLVQMVASTLTQTGLEPSRLELEVTESAVMQNMEESCRQMADLRALGITIAIDDFGTGYSTLSYLQHLPVDYIKIDQSFVREMSGGSSPARLVQAIVRMAHALDLKVTAEGVETSAELAALRHFGCDQVQGFLLGRPMPAEGTGSSYSDGVDPVALVS
jgi:EAL domain-containing protein (putative c-di-GMP-specific phosphodiesterase class I)